LEIQLRNEMDATLTIATKADNQLRHNLDVGGVLYKYDLPLENKPIEFKSTMALTITNQEDKTTPTQALMEALECDKDTAFESFVIKMNQSFNNEVDMYGDIQKAGDSQLKVSAD